MLARYTQVLAFEEQKTMSYSVTILPTCLIISVLAVLPVAVERPEASMPILYASNDMINPEIDMIVTGKTVSVGTLDQWKARKAKFDKCGLCGETQAFPEDL